MKPNKTYSRIEDMSPDGKLLILMESDGDIIVRIYGYDEVDTPCSASVEFCALSFGRGYSVHTRQALADLAEAMERDNRERPIE